MSPEPVTAPLLHIKLVVPPLRSGLVERPRLQERLNAGLRQGRRLTLVSAPAGYGKTTLLCDWLARLGRNVAWLTLDTNDNDPARFLTYLVAALQQAGVQIGRPLHDLLDLPQLPDLEALLARLLDDLSAHPAPLVLVLDDLHLIAKPALHDALGFFIEHQPSHVHTVLLTRQDPPLPLSRWRVRNQVTELRQRDLCFTPPETAAFLHDSMDVALSPADLYTLNERTEGWIAGLQMAALALYGADPSNLALRVERFSGRHHYVLDYLTDEVLRRQPASIQTFLLHTCILDRMCAPLCDSIQQASSESQDHGMQQAAFSQQRLEHLERTGLFVVPLDEERTWYRYHRLFAELLRARLAAERPGLLPELHRKAATWFEGEGYVQEAVHHALQSGDLAWAAEVIERVVRSRTGWTRLDGASLLSWIEALPQEILDARPRFQLLAVRALYVTGQRAKAQESLRALELWLRQEPARPGADAMLEQLATDQASYAALLGQVRVAKAWAQPVLARLGRGEPVARLRAASVLGLACLRAGEVDEASRALRDAIAATEEAHIPAVSVAFWCNLADVQLVQGRLRESLQSCNRGEKADTAGKSATERVQQPTYAQGFVSLQRAQVAYTRNELDAAQAYAQGGLDLLRRGRITLGTETLHALLACCRQAQGDAAGASAVIEQALQIARGNDIPRLISLISAYQARIWLAQNRLDAAAGWAETYGKMGETEYLREFQELTLAWVHLALGRAVPALSVLDKLLAPAHAAGRHGTVIEGEALRALALSASNKPAEAQHTLQHALHLAEPEGHIRPFVDKGPAMAALLDQTLYTPESVPLATYVRRLLATHTASQQPPSARKPAREQSDLLLDPLTARELDVLDLLAQGLTNGEIAHRLVVSLPTIKSHTRNLYGKLDVHSRRAAVARARELGLISRDQT